VAAAPAGPSRSEREAIDQLKGQWEAKKAAIKDLEEMRRRRVNELQTRLQEQRAIYAESHPLVMETVQSIEALSQDSPQLAQLRRQEAELHNQYLARSGRAPEPTAEAAARPIVREHSIRAATVPTETDDREMLMARSKLQSQMEQFNRTLERIDDARMQLDAASAAFKYRYQVIRPPQMPAGPEKPKPQKILGGGVFAALLLATLAAVVADLRTGRIFQRWQVERALGLPVIAEITRER